MLNVLILEDDAQQRSDYRKVIQTRIDYNPSIHAYDMAIAVCTDDPAEISAYLKAHPDDLVFALLDIEIAGTTISGIDVADEIRQSQPFASIVFITTHDELMPLTLQRRVEPLDFIYKESGAAQRDAAIKKDVDLAYQRYQRNIIAVEPRFSYQVMGSVIREINFSDLYYLEANKSHPHWLTLVGKNIRTEFKGELKKITAEQPNMIRCDKSYLVNPQNIVSFDIKNRTIYFDEAGKNSCIVSSRKVPVIRDFLKQAGRPQNIK